MIAIFLISIFYCYSALFYEVAEGLCSDVSTDPFLICDRTRGTALILLHPLLGRGPGRGLSFFSACKGTYYIYTKITYGLNLYQHCLQTTRLRGKIPQRRRFHGWGHRSLLQRHLIGTGAIATRYLHVQQAQKNAQLRTVVHYLAVRHPYHLGLAGGAYYVVAVAQCPHILQLGFGSFSQVSAAIGQRLFKIGQQFCCVVHRHGLIGTGGKVKFAGGQRHSNPAGQLCNVGGQRAHLHAARVWLPVILVIGNARQHLAGGLGFLLHFFEQHWNDLHR